MNYQKKNWGEGVKSENFETFVGNSNPNASADAHNLTQATYSVLKRIKNTAKSMKLLEGSATYNKKYKGLPKDTPVPEIPKKYMDLKQWDFREWWAGEAGLTKAAEQEGLRTGPPITHSTGWCLKIPAHRKRLLELLILKKVRVLYGAPTCSPWSRACTTMNPMLKELVRAEELGF